MPTKKAIVDKPEEIYQIKVTLDGSKPPIWRRLLVPASTTLEVLHYILQMAMEWQDSHLHEFEIGGQRFGPDSPMEDFGGPAVTGERSVRLFHVLGRTGTKARYTYDFGDGWEHTLTVEKRLAPEAGIEYPLCVAGKLHGPPEDCGGIYGYYNLVEAMQDPGHPEHEELMEWLDGEFDPEAFSIDEVNRRLAMLRPRRKAPKKKA